MSEDGLVEYECPECGDTVPGEEARTVADLVCPSCGASLASKGTERAAALAAKPGVDTGPQFTEDLKADIRAVHDELAGKTDRTPEEDADLANMKDVLRDWDTLKQGGLFGESGALAAQDPPSASLEERARNRPSARFLPVAAAVVGGALAGLGGLALHVWTISLFYKNWGVFWAIMAFLLPGFSELVALIACYWWGVWFYVLAVAGVFAGCACLGLGVHAGESPRSSLAAFVGTVLSALALAGSFGYFAVAYARAPEAITLEDRKHVDDLAVATCSVLGAAMSDDPDVASRVPEGKARLREAIAKCPQDLKPVLRAKVDSFLRVWPLFYDDVETYVRGLGRAGQPVFRVSDRTRSAMNKMPERIKANLEPQIASFEALFEKARTGARPLTREELDALLQRLAVERKRCWAQVKETYQDLLGAAMPSEAELIAKE